MDLRTYYQKIKELQSTFETRDIVVVSKPTVDGGLAGVVTEVPVELGCRLIVEDKARIATGEEIADYRGAIPRVEALPQKDPKAAAGKASPQGR